MSIRAGAGYTPTRPKIGDVYPGNHDPFEAHSLTCHRCAMSSGKSHRKLLVKGGCIFYLRHRLILLVAVVSSVVPLTNEPRCYWMILIFHDISHVSLQCRTGNISQLLLISPAATARPVGWLNRTWTLCVPLCWLVVVVFAHEIS